MTTASSNWSIPRWSIPRWSHQHCALSIGLRDSRGLVVIHVPAMGPSPKSVSAKRRRFLLDRDASTCGLYLSKRDTDRLAQIFMRAAGYEFVRSVPLRREIKLVASGGDAFLRVLGVPEPGTPLRLVASLAPTSGNVVQIVFRAVISPTHVVAIARWLAPKIGWELSDLRGRT